MKFRNFGQVLLASVVSLALCFGVTSCSNDFTVGYLYVCSTSNSTNGVVQGFRIDNNRGKLFSVTGPTRGSGGTNPVRMLIPTGGRFVFVLNSGCGATGQPACSSGSSSVVAGNITIFTIGGYGQISAQQSFATQGINPIRMQTDSSGKYLYVLDKTAPAGTTDNTAGNGDITVFSIDGNTGRLSLVTNSQTVDANGNNLTYFPVGKSPVDMKLVGSNLFIVDSFDQTIFPYQVNGSNGQLTVAQNGPQFITDPGFAVNIAVIGSGGSYVYLLNARDGVGKSGILPYTVGANAALQAVTDGPQTNYSAVPNPTALVYLTKGSNNFLYITNAGPVSGLTTAASDISGYNVATNGTLVQLPAVTEFKTDSGPQCIVEDPSSQYIYTANFNDSTVTGKVIESGSGLLDPLHVGTPSSYATAGQPTHCVTIHN